MTKKEPNLSKSVESMLKELKELVEVVNHKVGQVETNQGIYSAQLVLIKEKQSVLNDKLDDHTRRLEALSGDTEQLLTDVKGIRDEIGLWHQRDKREIDEIKVHVGLPIIPDAL